MKNPIHYLIPVILCFICYLTFAENVTKLKHVRVHDQRETYGRTIIYGSFMQIFGRSGHEYDRQIRIYNIDSNKYYSFDVTPFSKKEDFFRYYIPAGHYAIMKYRWGRSLRDTIGCHVEDVYKSGRMANGYETDDESALELDARFKFYVMPDTPTYVGVWHFENLQTSFSEDKKTQDSVETYVTYRKKLDLTKSLISIPH